MIGASFFGGSVEKYTLEQSPLLVTIECKSNPRCVYDGKPIELRIQVTNISTKNIEVPLDYLERRGPYVRLIDRSSGRALNLAIGFPDPDVPLSWEVIRPAASFILSASIDTLDLEPFRQAEQRDIDAVVNISTPVRLNNSEVTKIKSDENISIEIMPNRIANP